MNKIPLTAHQTIKLILRLKLQRFINQLTLLLTPSQTNGEQDKSRRTGTAGKSVFSPARMALIIFAVLIFIGGMSHISFSTLQTESITRLQGIPETSLNAVQNRQQNIDRAKQQSKTIASKPFLNLINFLITTWFLAILFITIGMQHRDIARLDADVEWLLTLPISIEFIYGAKLIERVVINIGWLVFPPLYGVLLWYWNYRWSLLPIALLLTLVITLLIATLQFIIEISAHRLLSAYRLNTFQALTILIGTILLAITNCFNFLKEIRSDSVRQSLQKIGEVAGYLPSSLALAQLQQGQLSGVNLVINLVINLFVIGMIGVNCYWLFRWASRHGLEAVQSSHSGQRGTQTFSKRATSIIGKELKMLRRDKTILAQTFSVLVGIIPLLFVPGLFQALILDPIKWGSIAICIALLMTMATLPNLLIHEGNAGWLLFISPKPLWRILLNKVIFWGGLALSAAMLIVLIGIVYRGSISSGDLITIIWLLIGIPLQSIMCASIGVLGTDMLSNDKRRRVREDLIVLMMLFGLILIGGIYLPGLLARAGAMFLFALITLAWAQKAFSHCDYLLDPHARPPARLYLAESLSAVVLFILLQMLFNLLPTIYWSSAPKVIIFLIAYLLSGIITIVATVSNLKREGVKLAQTLSLTQSATDVRGAIITTLIASLAVIVPAIIGSLLMPNNENLMKQFSGNSWDYLLTFFIMPVMTIVAIPIFEELLFRGLVYQSLRGSYGFFISALLTALLAALMQPAAMFVPVTLAGILMAWVYQRTNVIISPIFVHAVFNATLLAIQIAKSLL